MFRQVVNRSIYKGVVASTTASSFLGVHRSTIFSLRACSTATSSTPKRTTPDEEDDFVDLDALMNSESLAGLLEEDAERPILGVTRIAAQADDEKRSRLGVTVKREERYRSNSRAFNSPLSGEEVGEDAVPYGTFESSQEQQSKEKKEDAVSSSSTRFEADEEEGGNNGGGSSRDGRTMNGDLPFDDAGMADAILRMEVEGQIDETWQDSRRAEKSDCKEIVDIMKHMKVRDVTCIQTSGKTGSFDFIIMGTCEGSRHLNLCAWAVCEADKEHRLAKIPRRNVDNNWEVVPVGRIVVNLMTEALRSEMSLERKWAVTKSMDPLDSANAPISEGRQVKAHGLWTLTLNLQDLEDFEVDYCKDALLSQL